MEDNIIFITGDLFDTKANVILHQVNCQGVMGSGIAAEIKRRFPQAYEDYKTLLEHYIFSNKSEDKYEAMRIIERIQTLSKPIELIAEDRRILHLK